MDDTVSWFIFNLQWSKDYMQWFNKGLTSAVFSSKLPDLPDEHQFAPDEHQDEGRHVLHTEQVRGFMCIFVCVCLCVCVCDCVCALQWHATWTVVLTLIYTLKVSTSVCLCVFVCIFVCVSLCLCVHYSDVQTSPVVLTLMYTPRDPTRLHWWQ